ncbi:hypothetical protein EDD85DRAFT_789881 [Armillaria nabsnona]|nr:hypothetical protein EDD85DRAFT_789881 [Armillaria nabsnona]
MPENNPFTPNEMHLYRWGLSQNFEVRALTDVRVNTGVADDPAIVRLRWKWACELLRNYGQGIDIVVDAMTTTVSTKFTSLSGVSSCKRACHVELAMRSKGIGWIIHEIVEDPQTKARLFTGPRKLYRVIQLIDHKPAQANFGSSRQTMFKSLDGAGRKTLEETPLAKLWGGAGLVLCMYGLQSGWPSSTTRISDRMCATWVNGYVRTFSQLWGSSDAMEDDEAKSEVHWPSVRAVDYWRVSVGPNACDLGEWMHMRSHGIWAVNYWRVSDQRRATWVNGVARALMVSAHGPWAYSHPQYGTSLPSQLSPNMHLSRKTPPPLPIHSASGGKPDTPTKEGSRYVDYPAVGALQMMGPRDDEHSRLARTFTRNSWRESSSDWLTARLLLAEIAVKSIENKILW